MIENTENAAIMWHNPRCSKSRQTLQLLEAHGITPTIVKYLDTPPTRDELTDVLEKLGIEPRDLMRRKEAEYKELGLKDETDRDALINAMIEHPRLIERPVVITGGKAALGRPPESVLALF